MPAPVMPNAGSPFETSALDAEVKRFLTKSWTHRRSRKPVRVTDPIAVYFLSADALQEADPFAMATRNPMWAVLVEDAVKAQAIFLNDMGGKPYAAAMPEQSQGALLAALRHGRGIAPDGEVRWLLVDGGSSAAWLPALDDALVPALVNGVPASAPEVDADFLTGLAGNAGPSC